MITCDFLDCRRQEQFKPVPAAARVTYGNHKNRPLCDFHVKLINNVYQKYAKIGPLDSSIDTESDIWD